MRKNIRYFNEIIQMLKHNKYNIIELIILKTIMSGKI